MASVVVLSELLGLVAMRHPVAEQLVGLGLVAQGFALGRRVLLVALGLLEDWNQQAARESAGGNSQTHV